MIDFCYKSTAASSLGSAVLSYLSLWKTLFDSSIFLSQCLSRLLKLTADFSNMLLNTLDGTPKMRSISNVILRGGTPYLKWQGCASAMLKVGGFQVKCTITKIWGHSVHNLNKNGVIRYETLNKGGHWGNKL